MLSFAGKLVSGLVSMTMLLFSSYEGNDASFSEILIGHDSEAIRIRTTLLNAFDNDFDQIFRSGSPVVINYLLDVQRDGEHVETLTFHNIIIFDPMNRYFYIEAEASNFHSFTDSCDELRQIISEIDVFYDHLGVEGTYRFELTASMEKVTLESLEREFDLMLLWKNKIPAISFTYKVDLHES